MSLPLLYGLLFLLHHPSSAYEDSRWHSCYYTTTYPSNSTSLSTTTTILAQALDTLRQNTAPTGFNTTTNTNQTDSVTALALCRGSLTPPDCQTCIDVALTAILLRCSNHTAAQIWYDYCTVRYSAVNFIGKADFSIANRAADSAYGPDPVSYVESVEFLMSTLSSKASLSPKRFALGKILLPKNQMLYGYFDCTRDISSDDCATCFSAAMREIELWCITRRVCWVVTPSCNAQFSMDPAHLDWVNAPPIVDMTFLTTIISSSSNIGNNGNGGSDSNAAEFSVGVVAVTVALVVGLIILAVAVLIRAKKRGSW